MGEQRDLQEWLDRVQDYLDGNLSRTQALQFYLLARREPRLKQELHEYRQMIAALEQTQPVAPGPDFDRAILESVPLDRYRNAPQPPERVLVVGDSTESFAARLRRPVGRGLLAIGVAYALFLGVSHSFLSHWAARAAGGLRSGLDALATQVESVPVLSSVTHAASAVFATAVDGMMALSGAVGSGVVTVSVGLLAGAVTLALVMSRRRRADRRVTF